MRRNPFSLCWYALVCVFILTAPAAARAHTGAPVAPPGSAHPQKGHGRNGGGDRAKGRHEPGGRPGHAVRREEARRDWSDRDHCRVVVREYYGRHALPPGLARKRALPPGLRRQLRERGHLPPGLEGYWLPLPVELERTLPPLPPHHIRRWVDDDLVVIDVRTNFVVSIMAGVFIRR